MRAPLVLITLALGWLVACQSPERNSGTQIALGGGGTGAELAHARKLYTSKCSRCHKLYEPRKYSDAEWEIWLSKMSRKAKLKPDQQDIIAGYVETALRDHPAQSTAGGSAKP